MPDFGIELVSGLVSYLVASSMNRWVLSSWIGASILYGFLSDSLPLFDKVVFIFLGGPGMFLEFTYTFLVAGVSGGIALALGSGVLPLLVASVVGILCSIVDVLLIIVFKEALFLP